jgi:hypothetical protein
MNDQVHLGRTRLNSTCRFKRPMEVVEAAGIPTEAKFSILEAWQADERALQRAEDEGMAAASMRICSGFTRRSAGSRGWELTHSAEGG